MLVLLLENLFSFSSSILVVSGRSLAISVLLNDTLVVIVRVVAREHGLVILIDEKSG